MTRKKLYAKVFIAIISCFVGFYVNYNICIRYDEGFNAITMITIAAFSAVLCGISSFLVDDISKGDVIEGVISFALAIAILGCGYSSNLIVSYYLIAVFFIAASIPNAIFFAGAAKGSGKAGRTLSMWGFICLVISLLALFFSICPIFITLFRGSNEYLNGALKYIPMIIIFVGAALSLLIIMLKLVKHQPISNENNRTRSHQSSSSHQSYNQNTSSDYREKAVGAFYNILRDKCRSIAREFSSSHALTHGRSQFDVSVNVGSHDIAYTIDVSVSVTAQDQYEMNDLQASLKEELETVSQNIYYKTDTIINELRERFQDFDGEYNINVKVGRVR